MEINFTKCLSRRIGRLDHQLLQPCCAGAWIFLTPFFKAAPSLSGRTIPQGKAALLRPVLQKVSKPVHQHRARGIGASQVLRPGGVSDATGVGAKITDRFCFPAIAQQFQLPNEFLTRATKHILKIARFFSGAFDVASKLSLQHPLHNRPGFRLDQLDQMSLTFRLGLGEQKRPQQRIAVRRQSIFFVQSLSHFEW